MWLHRHNTQFPVHCPVAVPLPSQKRRFAAIHLSPVVSTVMQSIHGTTCARDCENCKKIQAYTCMVSCISRCNLLCRKATKTIHSRHLTIYGIRTKKYVSIMILAVHSKCMLASLLVSTSLVVYFRLSFSVSLFWKSVSLKPSTYLITYVLLS